MNNTSRIDLVMRSFSGGGAERAFVALANNFSKRGYSVRLIVFSSEGPHLNSLSKSVELLVLDRQLFGGSYQRVSLFFSIYKTLKESNAVVSMSTIRAVNLICSFICFIVLRRRNHVIREPDTLDCLTIKPFFTRYFERLIYSFLYKRAESIIANSEATKNDLIRCYRVDGKRVKVVYNPLNVQIIERTEAPKGMPFSANRIAACGRLTKKKNFDELLRAMAQVCMKKPEAELLILGSGVEEDRLKELARELNIDHSVRFLGFVENPYQYFKASAVFVQTSLWEGFGYVLAEALAAGCHSIAYDGRGAMREILGNGAYGDLVPVGETAMLAEKILERMGTGKRITCGQASAHRFHEDKIAQAYLAVLFSSKTEPL